MTCHDAREWLGPLVDDAIDSARRVEIEAHLSTCGDCRLELEGLRATVGLLRRVEPARAPAGFVDRVIQRANPAPWYRRAAAWLFLPLSVKLPAEAAAIVVIAGLAMLLVDRTPELRDAARVDPAPPPIAEAPPRLAPAAPAGVPRDKPGEQIATAPPAPRAEETRVARSKKAAPAPPATRREEARDASSGQVASTRVPAAPAEPTPPAPAAQSPIAAEAPRSPVAPQSPPPPIAAQSRPAVVAKSFEGPRERSQAERELSAPPPGRASGLAARAADVAGRLAVRDREVAVAALSDLLSKVGGRETARRPDGPDVVIEVLIPEARADDFVSGLEALGEWSASAPRERVVLDAPYFRISIRIAQ